MQTMYEHANDGCEKWKWMDVSSSVLPSTQHCSRGWEHFRLSTSVSSMWMCEWFIWSVSVALLVVVSPSVSPRPPSSWSSRSCSSCWFVFVSVSVKCRRPCKVCVSVACVVVTVTVPVAIAVAVGRVVVSVLIGLFVVGAQGSHRWDGCLGEYMVLCSSCFWGPASVAATRTSWPASCAE